MTDNSDLVTSQSPYELPVPWRLARQLVTDQFFGDHQTESLGDQPVPYDWLVPQLTDQSLHELVH